MNKDFAQTKSPLWLMINAITIPILVRRVFEKSAKAYKVDWENIPETSHDQFTDKGLYSKVSGKTTLKQIGDPS